MTQQAALKIGIVGYGNLGRGVELSIQQQPDMELVAIFSRRSPEQISSSSPVKAMEDLPLYQGQIDVMILCGGSSTDLPIQVLDVAKWFNTVDSYDTHAEIPAYFTKVDACATENGTLSVISTGWDPGLFSLMRLLSQSVLPVGADYTFWGRGLSQGHSDAIRRVPGVKNGVQYTIPREEALNRVRSGDNPPLTTADKHERVCYVVPESGANLQEIEHTIKTMPHYFAEYPTTVYFISEAELQRDHAAMPHGGMVLRTGQSGNGAKQRLEFSLALESNPEFTASVLVAYARAAARLSQMGQTGARTVLDIPLAYLSPQSAEELRRTLL